MYKKILALLLCAALLLFSGCSGETSSGDASPSSEASSMATSETTPMKEYDKTTLTDQELILLALSALQAGNTKTLLDLCADDEYVATGYAPLKTCMVNGTRAGVDYGIPQLSDQSTAMVAAQMRANYAKDIMGGLSCMAVPDGALDLTEEEANLDLVEKSTRQAEIFERYLGEFVFSDISVEYLARISLYDAEDLGLLGSGWVFSSDDLMEFADQGPMLSELSAKTYPEECGFYYAVLQYGDHYYSLGMPVFRYFEAGWRLQGFSIEPIDLGSDEDIPRLDGYQEIYFAQSPYALLGSETVSVNFGSMEEVVSYTLNALSAGDFQKLETAAQLDSYLENLDIASWVHGPFGGTSYSIVFPTTAGGFSELTKANLMEAFISSELWKGACFYAGGSLAKDDFYKEYASGFTSSMQMWHWQDIAAVEGKDGEEYYRFQEEFPADLAQTFFTEVERYWELLSTPSVHQPVSAEGDETQPDDYYSQIVGDSCYIYGPIQTNAEDGGAQPIVRLAISEHDQKYRLAALIAN